MLALSALSAVLAALTASGVEEPSGIVVEEVAKESAAARAGIQRGDSIEVWSRAAAPPANPRSAQGRIESPFDLKSVEVEEGPRGLVTLAGRRGPQPAEWQLPTPPYGLTVRPDLDPSLLASYEEGLDLVQKKEVGPGAERWRAAAVASKKAGQLWVSVWLWSRAAEALGTARAWQDADAAYEVAVREAEQGARPATAAQMLRDWGEAFRRRSEWDRAEERYRRALELDERLESESLAIAQSLNRLGMTSVGRGNLSAAEDYFRRSLALREKLAPGSLDVAWSRNNLGFVAREHGDLAAAEEHHWHALAIWEKLAPGSLDVATSLNNLGNVAWSRGDLAAAEGRYRRALALGEELAPGSLYVAASLNNLGIVAGSRGDLVGEEGYHRRALAIREEVAPESLDVSASLNNLGVVARSRGDLATAEEYYRRALAIKEKLAPGSLDVALGLTNLGNVARSRGDLATAEDHFRRALSIVERLAPGSLIVAEALNSLGRVTSSRGDLARAEEHHRRAVAILEKLAPGSLDVAVYLNELGLVVRSHGDLAAAEEYLRRALAIREKLATGSAVEAESLHDLALVQRQKGRAADALELLLRALDALERQRTKLGGTEEGRAGFLASSARYYHDTIETQIELGRPADAFHVLERSRARSLLALLAERDLLFTADLPPDLARERKLTDAEFDRVQAAIAKLSPDKDAEEIGRLLGRLRDLRREQEEIANKIRRSSPRLAALQYPQPLDLPGVRAVLDPGTAFLAYSVGQDKTTLFVVQPDGVPGPGLSVFALPAGEKALREKVEAFRGLIQRHEAPQEQKLHSQAAELYDLLLGPAETLLASSQRLLLSPDGPLHSLPFAALVRKETVRGKTRSSFLVEWKPLGGIASAGVFAEMKKSRRPAPSSPGPVLMAFADPRYPSVSKERADEIGNPEVRSALARGVKFAPLPSTRDEVENIAALFPGSARTYLGEEATEERAKSVGQDVRYVHFACHGVLDQRFPLNSGLALTIPERPAEGQDNGLLQAWEIFDRVRLDAELVTLSACETALGTEMGGEGLLGLVRAFHYAGARSVLASLWAVSDKSTAELMKRFYGHLKAGRRRDEALREAQIEMIRKRPLKGQVDRSRPYHWAAFLLSGDSQ